MIKGEVIVEAWTGSDLDDEEIHLHKIEEAIAKSGIPRAALKLRLSLNYDNCCEYGDHPAPDLRLVRPETEAERETRLRFQEGLLATNAVILTEEALKEKLLEMAATGEVSVA